MDWYRNFGAGMLFNLQISLIDNAFHSRVNPKILTLHSKIAIKFKQGLFVYCYFGDEASELKDTAGFYEVKAETYSATQARVYSLPKGFETIQRAEVNHQCRESHGEPI